MLSDTKMMKPVLLRLVQESNKLSIPRIVKRVYNHAVSRAYLHLLASIMWSTVDQAEDDLDHNSH